MSAIVILRLVIRQSRRGVMSLAAAGVLGSFGLSALAFGLMSQQSASRPPVSAAGNVAITPPTADSVPADTPSLDRSLPVSITIPSIQVSSKLITVGKNPDGTIEVPSGEQHDYAAWYKHSPTPGQFGSSVIEGHVDSFNNGPSVFFRLGDIRPNDTVLVDRADGQTAVFKVEAVREYDKNAFPTELVYGATDHASLRLITCSGNFSKSTNQYDKNIVVFASLAEVR
jgi:hypothetical protein